MSVRFAPLLLLAAACRPAHDPRSIQAALAATPIDIAALEEAFLVEPKALVLHVPEIPSVTFAAPREPWVLENVSRRPVWLRLASLGVDSTHEPFVPGPDGRYLRGRRLAAEIPRPAFKPEEWILLPPGGRTALFFRESGWEPGTIELRADVGDSGASLVHQAREFNEKSRSPGDRPRLAAASARTMLLPPLDWPGAPWHETYEISLLPLSRGRFALTSPASSEDAHEGLDLEAFVVDAGRRLVVRGELQALPEEPGRRALFGLPAPLPAGAYFLLVRTPDAAAFFSGSPHRTCPVPDAAASRWIPFTIE